MVDSIEIEITDLAFGGKGIGKAPSGKTIFVIGGAPQDRVQVRIIEDRRSYSVAIIEDILVPSPHRVKPACALASLCGGCSWMHMNVTYQRHTKENLFIRELTRYQDILGEYHVRPIVVGKDFGFRTRCRLHRRGQHFGTMQRRSSYVLDFARCPILVPSLEEYALELNGVLKHEPPSQAEIELYVDVENQRGMYVEAFDSPVNWKAVAARLDVDNLVFFNKGTRKTLKLGNTLFESSYTKKIAFEPGLFVQSNRDMNSTLVRKCLDHVPSGTTFLEFYAGVGNFTVHLAERFEKGYVFERNHKAIQQLRTNIAPLSTSIHTVSEEDRRSAGKLRTLNQIDCVLADPPRAGMKPLVHQLGRLGPKGIIIVSCHPMTAIRDIKLLCSRYNYRLSDVFSFDFFPQTDHLETMSILSISNIR